MADRLISADKLAKDIYRAWTLWEKKGEDCYVFSDIITPLLINQPTIEAEPRKHGKWINCGWSIRCSECGYDMPFSTRNYCPNCGAKMGEVEE